jgi:WhiB family redox-sensing transcriptional regulator
MTARVGVLTLPAWVPGFVPEGVRPPCRDVDPELFFPVGETYSDAGRKVCRRCPVKVACVKWAIRTGERYGIYGGMDPKERAKIASDVAGYADIPTSRSFPPGPSVKRGGGE